MAATADSPPGAHKRPPAARKKKEPLYEEDIIDGFAIFSFKTYEDLQSVFRPKCDIPLGGKSPSRTNNDRKHHHEAIYNNSTTAHRKLEKIFSKNKHANHHHHNNNQILDKHHALSKIYDFHNEDEEEEVPPPVTPRTDRINGILRPSPKDHLPVSSASETSPRLKSPLYSPLLYNKKEVPAEATSVASPRPPLQNGAQQPEPNTGVAARTLQSAMPQPEPTTAVAPRTPQNAVSPSESAGAIAPRTLPNGTQQPEPSTAVAAIIATSSVTSVSSPTPVAASGPPPSKAPHPSPETISSRTATYKPHLPPPPLIPSSSPPPIKHISSHPLSTSSLPSLIPPKHPLPSVTPPVSSAAACSSTPLAVTTNSSSTVHRLFPNFGPHLVSSASPTATSHSTPPPPSTRMSCYTSPSISSLASVVSCSTTPGGGRDSSSNSSLSSLSLLSQSLQSSGGSSRSRSSSRGNITPQTSAPVASAPSSALTPTTASYNIATNLVFSKPSLWSSTTTSSLAHSSQHLNNGAPHSSQLPSNKPPPSTLPLPPTLHTSATPSYGITGSHHHSLFPPTASSLSLAPGNTLASPSESRHQNGPFVAGETGTGTLFPPSPAAPPASSDLLRRELDTRFLVSSQDITSPYMRSDLAQHHHVAAPPFIPPPLVPPPPSQATANPATTHMYDKYTKLESPLYGRSTLGLGPTYQSLSHLLAPAHSSLVPPPPASFPSAPKIPPVTKAKPPTKAGRWCAMHVRIAWEIYHHQQKQSEKAKLLRPPPPPTNPMFPRQELPPSAASYHATPALLGSTAAGTVRPPFETAPTHPNAYLNPTPAHYGLYGRTTGYPNLSVPVNSLGPLGLGGYAGSMDPWGRMPRVPPTFPPSATASPWSHLKSPSVVDLEPPPPTAPDKTKADHYSREKQKEQERQKERDRHFHLTTSSHHPVNGEVDRTRSRERREPSRSPIRKAESGAFDLSEVKVERDLGSADRLRKVERAPDTADLLMRTFPSSTTTSSSSSYPAPLNLECGNRDRRNSPYWTTPPATTTESAPPAPPYLDREQLMQRYSFLSTVMPPLHPEQRLHRDSSRHHPAAGLPNALDPRAAPTKLPQATESHYPPPPLYPSSAPLYLSKPKMPPPPLIPCDPTQPPSAAFFAAKDPR